MLINTPRFLNICLMTKKVVVEHTQTYKHSQRTCGWSSHIPFHRCRLPYLHIHPSWRCGCSCFWGTPTAPHNPLMPMFVRKLSRGPIHELRWGPYTLHLVPIPAGRMLGWASAEVVVLQEPHLAVPDQVLTAFFSPLQIFMCLLYFSSWLLCFKRLFVTPWLLFNHAAGHHLYHDKFWENTLGHFWVFYLYTLVILPFLPSSLLSRPPCKGQAVWTPTPRLSETVTGVESD